MGYYIQIFVFLLIVSIGCSGFIGYNLGVIHGMKEVKRILDSIKGQL